MRLNITSSTSSDGVIERRFTLGEIPGVLWTPEGATGIRPLILMGHGGGQHKTAPRIVAGARRFAAECGFTAVAIDAPGPVGYLGMSLGCGLGVPLVAAEPRIRPGFETEGSLSFFARHLG